MHSCTLCNKQEGEPTIKGVKIAIGEHGVCNVCSEELANLEKLYMADFEDRTGQKIDMAIPWPAIREFTWPPHSAVIVSGWELRSCEFAIGLAETSLISGRRSIRSFEEEAAKRMAQLSKQIEASKSYEERALLRRDYDRFQRGFEKIEDLARAGERQLFIIPLANMQDFKSTKQDGWIAVEFRLRKQKTGFFGGRKDTLEKHRLLVSTHYMDFVKELEARVRREAGP